ncbi:MAG: hypothetical protein JXQ83_13595, partial [Candidatus Glassbacteria bacterium]|nr:hypothetical protein [Candidatus Glassbacteria bacterium]
MDYRKIIRLKNLELAWRRLNTGSNLQYKQFFRPLYFAYEAGLASNLKDLHKKLKRNVWCASEPLRTYLPKPSGLQRPITLLHLEDQIVYQAVVNEIAEKVRKRRKELELKWVFSNILCDDNDSIFFLHRWQNTYTIFQNECKKHFLNGYRWINHFDLSAYYDTISHVHLINIINPRNGFQETSKIFREWLEIWTKCDGISATNHGIPQGPIASDFLAEIFFLPIDQRLKKLTVRYVRYVDDIRIFGRTSSDVQRAAIELEQACRESGLIPQDRKYAIKKAKSLSDAMGLLPSLPPQGEEKPDSLKREQAESLFEEGVGGNPIRCNDKTRLRYVLYRAPVSQKILR